METLSLYHIPAFAIEFLYECFIFKLCKVFCDLLRFSMEVKF